MMCVELEKRGGDAMTPTKSKRYFDYLVHLVDGISEMPEASYTMLLKILYSRPFVSIIPNDDNRAIDGLELRKDFQGVIEEYNASCSVLEMLIALAKRMAYMLSDENTDESSSFSEYFWMFIRNLDLEKCSDDIMIDEPDDAVEYVEHVIDRLVYREYMSDGWGGISPLQSPPGDQRTTEIWYQMQSYMIENFE